MERVVSVLIRIYAQLLRFYPRSYWREFAGEMLQDFSALAADASRAGRLALFLFCLRELVDFPMSLVQAHLKENGMLMRMRAEPLHTAWRGALVFGSGFFLSVWLHSLVFWTEANVKILIPDRLQFLFERYVLDWTSTFLTALGFGVLLALLFAGRDRFWHYFLVGALGWFLQLAVLNFLEYFFDFESLLNRPQQSYIDNLRFFLRGTILGAILVFARAEGRGVIGALAACAIAYPLATFFTVKWAIGTGWLFPALAIVWFMLLASIFILAYAFSPKPQRLLTVLTGAVGLIVVYFILATGFFLTGLMPPVPPEGFFYENPLFWPVTVLLSGFNLVLGSSFGWLLGWSLGSQKTEDFQQLAV